MDWITEHVAIGDYREAQNAELLRREKIRSVLSLNGALRKSDSARLGVEAIAGFYLMDGPNELRLFHSAVDTLVEFVRQSPPVLVHCRAGRSRSPAVVAAYLTQALDLDPDEALAYIAARRQIHVAPELKGLVEKLYWA